MLSRIIDDLKVIFEPVPDKSIADWAQENIKLPPGLGAGGSDEIDWDLTPEIPFILACFKNPEVREIVLVFHSQGGKTTILIICAGWKAVHDPVNILWLLPDAKTLNRFSSERLRKTYDRSNVGLQTERSARKMNLLRFEKNYIYLGIASSSKDAAGDPMGMVYVDEEDKNPPTAGGEAAAIELARDRCRTFRGREKIIRACTPQWHNRGVWPAFHKSRMHELLVKCPKCRKKITLEFKQLNWPRNEAGHSLEPQIIKTQHLAWYVCQECGHKMFDKDRASLLKTIEWVCTTPDMPMSVVGFRKPVQYSNFENWSSIAARWLEVKGDMDAIKSFYNGWICEPQDVSAKVLKESVMRDELCSKHDSFFVPESVYYITAGVDVGENEAWVLYLGWGAKGELHVLSTMKLKFEGDFDIDIVKKNHESINWKGNTKARFIGGAIDAGYRTADIYGFCKKNANWLPMMGYDARLKVPWRLSPADPKRRYGKKSTGLVLYTVSNPYWQDILQAYISRGRGAGSGHLHFPADVNQNFLKHLSNEVKKIVVNKSNNRMEERWITRYKGAPNHLRDCGKYAIAMGHIREINNLYVRIKGDRPEKKKTSSKMKSLSKTWERRR